MEYTKEQASGIFRLFTQLLIMRGLLLGLPLFAQNQPSPADWVRGTLNPGQPAWGLRHGLVFGIHPAGPTKNGEAPRGLIRLFYPVLDKEELGLVNLLTILPVVKGQMAFSELELSRQDGLPGKHIWTSESSQIAPCSEPGKLTRLALGVEQLEVTFHVEPFANGAHVSLVVCQRSNAPDEIQMTIHREPGGAPMEYCTLSATAGSFARTRLLWLKDEVISSKRLYPDYSAIGFAPPKLFPEERLFRTTAGDVLVATTTDEENPAAVLLAPSLAHFLYRGAKVTQYWRKPSETLGQKLVVAVNGRYTYWKTTHPIAGGITFENFELQQRFTEGQTIMFGITRRTPAELGFSARQN